jgi:hypothetical protein
MGLPVRMLGAWACAWLWIVGAMATPGREISLDADVVCDGPCPADVTTTSLAPYIYVMGPNRVVYADGLLVRKVTDPYPRTTVALSTDPDVALVTIGPRGGVVVGQTPTGEWVDARVQAGQVHVGMLPARVAADGDWTVTHTMEMWAGDGAAPVVANYSRVMLAANPGIAGFMVRSGPSLVVWLDTNTLVLGRPPPADIIAGVRNQLPVVPAVAPGVSSNNVANTIVVTKATGLTGRTNAYTLEEVDDAFGRDCGVAPSRAIHAVDVAAGDCLTCADHASACAAAEWSDAIVAFVLGACPTSSAHLINATTHTTADCSDAGNGGQTFAQPNYCYHPSGTGVYLRVVCQPF